MANLTTGLINLIAFHEKQTADEFIHPHSESDLEVLNECKFDLSQETIHFVDKNELNGDKDKEHHEHETTFVEDHHQSSPTSELDLLYLEKQLATRIEDLEKDSLYSTDGCPDSPVKSPPVKTHKRKSRSHKKTHPAISASRVDEDNAKKKCTDERPALSTSPDFKEEDKQMVKYLFDDYDGRCKDCTRERTWKMLVRGYWFEYGFASGRSARSLLRRFKKVIIPQLEGAEQIPDWLTLEQYKSLLLCALVRKDEVERLVERHAARQGITTDQIEDRKQDNVAEESDSDSEPLPAKPETECKTKKVTMKPHPDRKQDAAVEESDSDAEPLPLLNTESGSSSRSSSSSTPYSSSASSSSSVVREVKKVKHGHRKPRHVVTVIHLND